jgi:hypothetical protein
MPDIDIDFANRLTVLNKFKHVPARLKNRKHNTGVYCHRVPSDPFKGLCTLDHKAAEKADYFKLDLLNVAIYKDVHNEEHLTKLMNTEPLWELLQHKEFVEQIFHIGNHYEVIKNLKPTSIPELAATIAVIRPAKRYLLDQGWDKIKKEVWIKPSGSDAYYFKKAHAVAYAVAIVVHMNLVCESIGQ